jgi:hypothetical protein
MAEISQAEAQQYLDQLIASVYGTEEPSTPPDTATKAPVAEM